MKQYRIKIEQLINGKTRYIPQECFLVEKGGWIKGSWGKRTNIRWDDMHPNGGFELESDALEMINYVRGYREKKEGEQVKSVTYKNI